MIGQNVDAARAEIRSLILSGEYRPGVRLAEPALAERLGMSRTPVREALRRLQSDGLVAAGPGGGMVVSSLTAAEISDAYDVREALEVLVAETATRRQTAGEIPPADLASIAAVNSEMLAAGQAEDAARAAHLNAEFHERLAALSANTLAIETLRRIRDRFLISSRDNLTDPAWRLTSAEQHGRIVAAVTAGDMKAARQAVIEHTNAARAPSLH